jgi:dsDNA-specific endonuclease/ATPase MutS2
LGLPCDIIESARELYGSASAEINEVILDMERYKQEYQRLLNESRVYIRLSRELHENLLTAQKNINDHSTKERRKMRQELTQAGSMTRSTLRRTLQQFRSSAGKSSQSKVATQLQTKVKTTKDEDNGIRSSSVVERRPLPGIEISLSPLKDSYYLVMIFETEPCFCINRSCGSKGS